MVVWDLRLDQQALIFGDAVASLYMIQSDIISQARDIEHSHSYYEIHLLQQGQYTFSIDKRAVPAHSGEMVVIAPHIPHKAVIPNRDLKRCVLALTVKKRADGDPVYGQMIRCLNAHTATAHVLPSGLREKIDTYTHIPVGGSTSAMLHRQLAACEIIIGLFDAMGIDEERAASSGHVDFEIALEALVQNTDASLCQIARELGYSERQLSRKIKERYGKTFTQLRKK